MLTKSGEVIDAETIGRERLTCQDGHGKVWFRAAVTVHRQDTTADCEVRAYDESGHRLFKTFQPVELLAYPFKRGQLEPPIARHTSRSP